MKNKIIGLGLMFVGSQSFALGGSGGFDLFGDKYQELGSQTENCADFSGSWSGSCSTQLETAGSEKQTQQKELSFTIEQKGCNSIGFNGGRQMLVNVSTTKNKSGAPGFVNKSYAFWWEGENTLGFDKQISGVKFTENRYQEYRKTGKLSVTDSGVRLVASGYKMSDVSGKKVKVSFTKSCELSR